MVCLRLSIGATHELNFVGNDRRKKIMPNKVQTKCTRLDEHPDMNFEHPDMNRTELNVVGLKVQRC